MPPTAGTNRHVPEFALVTGAFLSLSFLVAGLLLTGDLTRTLLTSVVILYPFAAYAVTHSPDPTGVLPPRVTSLAAVAVGSVLAGSVVVPASGSVATDLPFALFLGACVVAPPAAYHARYGSRGERLNPCPPVVTALVTTAVALFVLGYGLLVGGTLFAAATALLAFVGGTVYARACGARLATRTRRRFVAGGAVAGVGVVLVGLTREASTAWLLVGLCVAAAPTLFYALTAPERA
jgi:hypothetical protein